MLKNLVFALLISSLFAACSGDYTPKPRAFFRIDLPEKHYISYNNPNCAYSFEVPDYAVVNPDDERKSEPCWLNVDFPKFKGRLHLSYKEIHNNLNAYMEDSRGLAYKHTIKASAINEKLIHTSNNVVGILYEIGGNTASSVQFFGTDSTKHFVRGSLYFYAVPQSDSIAPVLEFISKDIEHLINTLKWKN